MGRPDAWLVHVRRRLLNSTLALVVLLTAWAGAAGPASAATGGAAAPSGGGTPAGSAAQSTPARHSTGANAPIAHTGGVTPGTVRPPSAPVKQRKPRKRRPTRRHPAPNPAPAPAPAPTPAPAPAPAPAPSPGPTATSDIPAAYLQAYRAAAQSAGIDWRILAAIGKNESDHGRSTAPGVASGRNFADCCSGPMQLCTVKSCGNAWQYYAVDASGDGVASVYDPVDSIYAAAALVRDLQAIVGTDPKLILAAYNAGPGNVARYKGVPPFPETQAYVRAGLAYMALLP